jgi:hypothetical protein
MVTKVVNLKNEKYDIYIGRAGYGKSGYFGNPIKRGKFCQVCGKIHVNKGSTIKCFKVYFHDRIEKDEEFKNAVLSLKGKILGCFCKPKDCHGDIIVEYLNSIK